MAKDLEISFLLDFYGDVLTEKQRDVMQQYYNDDYSLSEIAENFGITRQGVRDSIKRGEAIILELEQKIGFAKKYRNIQKGVSDILTCTRDIEFYNNNSYSPNEEIRKAAQKILAVAGEIAE